MKLFDVAVIDPPWKKRKGGLRSARPLQGRALAYATMGTDEIFNLLDGEGLLAGTVFMWCVDEFLLPAEQAMAERGYKRHARLIWDKGNGVAPAFTVRYSHEYLVWFYQSPMPPVAVDARGKFTTVIRAPGREHSRKPDEAYSLVEALYPGASRVDVFSRESREGWAQWGDQLQHFGVLQ